MVAGMEAVGGTAAAVGMAVAVGGTAAAVGITEATFLVGLWR